LEERTASIFRVEEQAKQETIKKEATGRALCLLFVAFLHTWLALQP
jgi:hypothetical protein